MLHSICQQIWKTQQWPQDRKRSVFIPVPKKGRAKECSYYWTVAFISHGGKVMLKILQARLQQYVNWELPDEQAGFRKGRVTRDQIANVRWIIEKARELKKNIYFCFFDYLVMFPKAHLTSHTRMSGSQWVTTSSWLTGSLRTFLYSSSVYSCHHFIISSASVSHWLC